MRHPALILSRQLRRLAGERVTASRSRRTSLLTEEPASVLSPDPTTVVVGCCLFRCDRSAPREAGTERAVACGPAEFDAVSSPSPRSWTAHAAITSITDPAAATTGSRLNLLNALINETSARLGIDSLGPASETAAAARGPDPAPLRAEPLQDSAPYPGRRRSP